MITVVLSDCHARPELLANALYHAKTWDRLIFAGDFLDIGTNPERCLRILQENGAEILWGNHEASILYARPVSPQSEVSWEFRGLLNQHLNDWPIAAVADGVLITHAGLSSSIAYDRPEWTAEQWASRLNEMFSTDVHREFFWANYSPLWYRPSADNPPAPGLVQIAGHTPPQYLDEYECFHVIDPYARGMDDTRYRYAVIEDGQVTVVDSEDESDGYHCHESCMHNDGGNR